MTSEPMPCEQCGQLHARCKGHRRDGQPCGQPRMTGQLVCKMHGGKSPQALAAAEQRTQEREAEATIAKLWPGLAAAAPVKDPVDQMERLAGALTGMLDVVGSKVNGLEHLAGGTGLTQLRGELVLLDKVAGHLRQLLADMARLGIAERQVRLEEEQAAIITAAFRAALAAVSLVPADRDLMVRTFLEQLGQPVVPGEVA